MVLLLILAVAASGAEAATTAPVDPALVGTWKLAQPGLNMIWQIRADGSYRYVGVNARPVRTLGHDGSFGWPLVLTLGWAAPMAAATR